MFFSNFYENGYLYWFVVHNLQMKNNLWKTPLIFTFFISYIWMFYINSLEIYDTIILKVEKVKHMKLEVMRPKTKNNMNFQPE